MRRIFLSLFIAVLFAPPLLAQPLADRVPANALVYFGWRGSDDLGPGYADSHLKAIIDQSNFRAVIDDMFPRAIQRIGQYNRDAIPVMETIRTLASPMYRHPTAIFLGDVTVEKQNRGANFRAKAGVVCQAGADAPKMLAELQKLIAQIPADPDLPIRAAQDGDVVSVTINYADNELPASSGGAASLAKDASFSTAFANVQKDPVLCLYINFERSFSIVDQAMTLTDDPQVKTYWPKIRDASGLAGLKHILVTSGFDGQDWMDQAFIDAPAPRKGLLSMLDGKPMNMELLKAVPENAELVFGGSFDIAKFVSVVHDAVTQVDTNAGLKVTQALGLVSMYIGRDFQKDVLAPIGEHWVIYTSPTIAGRGGLGAILINDVNDPAKAQSGLFTTQAAAFNTLRPFLPNYLSLRCDTIKAGDLSITYFALPLLSPAWAVQGKNMYVALYPQPVISAARFGASGGKSITDNASFNAVRKRLGGPDNLTGFTYADMSQTAGEGYQTVLALSRLVLGGGDLFGVKSPEPVIPTLDVFLQHIKPGGSISYVDDAGWHSKGVSSFPGVEFFSGGSSGLMSMAPQLTQMFGILLPSMNRARVQAQNVQDMAKLRQIGMGCVMYATDHKGVLPQTLGDITAYLRDPHMYVDADHAQLAATAVGLPADQLKDWIDQNTDWEYLGNGQKLSAVHNASETVLAYQKVAPADGRVPVLFVDGHVEELDQAMLQQKLAKQ